MNQIKEFNVCKTIVKPFNAGTGSTIVTLYENSNLYDYKVNLLSKNGFIKNLKAYAKITSLAEATLPSFAIDDSETDKLYKTLNVEWGSARKQLNLYISNDRSTWQPIGAISLLNPSGYPYRIYNLLDLYTDNLALEIGLNGRIGANIQDVGYGLLSSGDMVTIYGSYLEEFVIQEDFMGLYNPANQTTITSSVSSVSTNDNIISDSLSTTATQILAANTSRKGLTVFNPLDTTVYVDGNNAVSESSFLVSVAAGQYYEFPYNYQGPLYGILASGTGSVNVREFI